MPRMSPESTFQRNIWSVRLRPGLQNEWVYPQVLKVRSQSYPRHNSLYSWSGRYLGRWTFWEDDEKLFENDRNPAKQQKHLHFPESFTWTVTRPQKQSIRFHQDNFPRPFAPDFLLLQQMPLRWLNLRMPPPFRNWPPLKPVQHRPSVRHLDLPRSQLVQNHNSLQIHPTQNLIFPLQF